MMIERPQQDRIFVSSLGGRSEEISQVCVVWGKAVAVSRYHLSPHSANGIMVGETLEAARDHGPFDLIVERV